MNVNSLKNLQIKTGMGIDDLIGYRSELKSLAANYDDLKLSIPEWISFKLEEVELEIKSQVKSERMATLQKLKSRKAALMTTDEKRKLIDNEIAALESAIK